MTDERSTFETTKARLEDIVTQVKRKDVSLEQSLDMLEEAVRLVNQCNELIDQTSFTSAPAADDASDGVEQETAEAADTAAAGDPEPSPAAADAGAETDAGPAVDEPSEHPEDDERE